MIIWRGPACQGGAGRGPAWQGMGRRGAARLGPVCHGEARCAKAGQGGARLGWVWRGKAWVAIATIAFVSLTAPQVAQAWHPLLSGQPACTDTGWSVTWTVSSSVDGRGVWWVESPDGYAPAGEQADELPFTRTTSHSFAEETASETVSVDWSKAAPATATAAVTRPEGCVATTTTTEASTTSSTTSTTSPTTTAPSTTTSIPTSATTSPDSTPAPTTTVVASTSTSPPSTTNPVPFLPPTGGDSDLAAVATLLAAGGCILARLARRGGAT